MAGFRNVTASYGTSGFTDDHLTAFKKYSIKRVLIAYDRDDAGNKAAEKLAEQLMAEGIECFRVLFPKDRDANSYALDVKPAAKMEKENKKEKEVKNKSESEPKLEIKPEPETEPKSIPSLAAGSCSSEPTQASPLPEVAEDIKADVSEHEVKISLGDRHYRIRGLSHNNGYEQLKINLRVTWGEFFYVDTLDLYLAKQRTTYIKHAGMELSLEVNLLKRDLGKILLKLEALQDERIQGKASADNKKVVVLSEVEHTAALELLKSPKLMQRIV